MSQTSTPITQPFAAHQQALREQLNLLLQSVHTSMYNDVKRVFEEPGKLLAAANPRKRPTQPAGVWPLLTYLIAHHVDPTISQQQASTVAVAVECFLCALDLLDDVEDDDETALILELGPARALNISTLLLGLTQQALLSFNQDSLAPAQTLRLLAALQDTILTATAGQHRDLLAEQRLALDLTVDECIEIAAWKAGALMRLACLLGALCAGADEQLCAEFAELGRLSGIAAQLDNDSHDLYYLLQNSTPASSPDHHTTGTRSEKTDIMRHKKTLPVVIAAANQEQATSLLPVDQQPAAALHEGIIATWGFSLLYRTRARECLQKIEARQTVSPLLYSLLGFQ